MGPEYYFVGIRYNITLTRIPNSTFTNTTPNSGDTNALSQSRWDTLYSTRARRRSERGCTRAQKRGNSIAVSTNRIFGPIRTGAARRRSIGIRVKPLGRLATRLGRRRHDSTFERAAQDVLLDNGLVVKKKKLVRRTRREAKLRVCRGFNHFEIHKMYNFELDART